MYTHLIRHLVVDILAAETGNYPHNTKSHGDHCNDTIKSETRQGESPDGKTYKIALQYASFNASVAAVATAGPKDSLNLAVPPLTADRRSETRDSERPALMAA